MAPGPRIVLDANILVRAILGSRVKRIVTNHAKRAEFFAPEVYESLRAAALSRIESRDPDDWPILAAALMIECPIWTEDQDFFGTGVPTWTTDRVELHLSDNRRD